MSTSNSWHLEGNYFEACNCETACPCVWFNPPSEGDCKLLVAWHIDKGRSEGVTLDGLNVVLACYAPGHMKEGNWQAALYLDERADSAQSDALVRIFSGQSGGHPAVLAGFVGQVLGVKHVPMTYEALGKERRLLMSDLAEVSIRAIDGIAGGEATIANPPLCVVPSHPSVVAKSGSYRYRDYGFDWEFSGRNGYFSPFVYHS
ncbi:MULTISPECIES: DUF1326 domain-containing protein [Methylocaldum]|jgi:hypothetical protein|uniref:DUF1326 domain-containing protein n=1 Tax=unclassified Methylocaldum TaxID=2622260 RepID=UPI000989E7C5|nr:DUF1326 domain-containing protein [Methylocaldum sp. 14B]MVF23791.1 DUF1326 domain-containing protein [Methylocaldum sp. BRCS4]